MAQLNNKSAFVLALLITLYIAYFSWFTINRYHNFASSYYDLGIMDQTVYNTSRGRILELTAPEGTETIKRMAIHNDPLLAFLAPFYYIYSGPETLLVIQTVVLALGAIPLYLLGIKFLKSKSFGLVLAFSYLMYPPLQRANIFDFHAVTLATTLLLYMVYFFITKRYKWGYLMFVLALLSKEQVPLATGLFGLLLLLQNRSRFTLLEGLKDHKFKRIGMVLLFVSVIWFVLSMWVIIPHFRGGEHFALDRYGEFGTNMSDIVKGIVTKPNRVIAQAFGYKAVRYYFWIFSPTAFLSFFSPYLFITLPEFGVNVLSTNSNMQDIIHHYTAVITPFVFLSTLFGVYYLRRRNSWFSMQRISLLIIICTLLASFRVSPLPYSSWANFDGFPKNLLERSAIYQWKEKLKDETIKVSVTDTLAPHFAHRITLSRFSPLYTQADYVVISIDSITNDWFNLGDTQRAYSRLLSDPHFQLVEDTGIFEVYKKL